MKRPLIIAALSFGALSAAPERDIDGRVDYGYTRLYNAACAGDDVLCQILLDAGANSGAFTQNGLVFYGKTPLQGAALYGEPEVCELLLKNGADINATRVCDETPLHLASRRGHTETVAVLLVHKELIDTDYDGWTPLHEAVKSDDNTETCAFLLQNAASLNITKEDVRDALDYVDEDAVVIEALLTAYLNS